MIDYNIGWIVGIIAAIAGAYTAFARVYKFGPFLEKEAPTSPESTETPPITNITETMTTKPDLSPTTYPKATLENFLLAIRDFEGKPGDQNYRLNNPGNCRYNPTGYLPIYGKVGRSPNGFAVFSSYEIGWKYLTRMVEGQISKHPNWSILDFVNNYAPASDNNPVLNYANFIAKRLGVSVDFKMKGLV